MSGSGLGHRGTRAWQNSLLSNQHFLPPSRSGSLLWNSKQWDVKRKSKKKKKKIKMKESEKWAKCFTLGPLLENCARLSRCLREQGILHGAADTDCPWKTDKPRRVGGGGGTKHTNVEALVLMRNMRHRQWTQKTVCLAVYVLRRIQMDGGEGDYAAGLLFQSLILFFAEMYCQGSMSM